MAWKSQKGRPKSGIIPEKFRDFVKDVRSRTKDLRHDRNHDDIDAFSTMSSRHQPADDNDTHVSQQVQDDPEPFPDRPSGLTVHTSLNFHEPLDFSYGRNYEASPSLIVTERLCQGLLRRVDHCANELITRKDLAALGRTSNDGRGKPARYEIQIRIAIGSEIWATRIFNSYQKQPLDAEGAKEITLSVHRMIGIFLRTHDQGFVWTDGPIHDDASLPQGTHPYRSGRVQPLSCIPRHYFLGKSQAFETIPGFTITLDMTSRTHDRKPNEWQKTIEINSHQTTPLNLSAAEKLFFDTSFVLDQEFRTARQSHKELSDSRNLVNGGRRASRERESDGVELKLSVSNNLGPQFDHLEREIMCRTALFIDAQARDCDEFICRLETAFNSVRDEADEFMGSYNDLDFGITELRGRGWALEKPLVFTIDPHTMNPRRDVEAIMERAQNGVADILRGNAMTVRMTAFKRGHFILDKTLVAKDPLENARTKKTVSPEKSKESTINRLQKRIEKDIEMVCRDTCSLDEEPEEKVETSRKDSSVLHESTTASEAGILTPGTDDALDSWHEDCDDTMRLDSTLAHAVDASSNGSSSGIEAGEARPAASPRSLTFTRDPITGVRSFPLLPTPRSDEGHERSIVSDFPSDGENEYPSQTPSYPRQTVTPPESTVARDTEGTPKTPSLYFGGDATPMSTRLITPKAYNDSIHSKDIQVSDGSMSSRRGPNSKGGLSMLERSPSKHRMRPSSVQNSEVMGTSQPSSSVQPKHEHESLSRSSPKPPQSAEGVPAVDTSVTQAASESSGDSQDEDGAPLLPEPVKEATDFSQSKPDFDFSSPACATTPGASPTAAEHPQTPGLDATAIASPGSLGASPGVEAVTNVKVQQSPATPPKREFQSAVGSPSESENGESMILAPVPRRPRGATATAAAENLAQYHQQQQQNYQPPTRSVSHTHRKSFGSAGFLGGFREDGRMVEVGLRRALMGSPLKGASPSGSPGSSPVLGPALFGNQGEENKRPSTAK